MLAQKLPAARQIAQSKVYQTPTCKDSPKIKDFLTQTKQIPIPEMTPTK